MVRKDLNKRVIGAKKNDIELAQLLEEYQPFIASELSKITQKYVYKESDELLSIGQMAFYEAVRSFDQKKGNFISYASIVIRSRCIDEIRKRGNNSSVNQSSYEEDILTEKSMKVYEQKKANDEMTWIIREFEKELLAWEIELTDLVKQSPKSQKNKAKFKSMARFLYDNEKLNEQIRKNKRLPIQLLKNQFNMNRKKIERGRIYILACFILLDDRYFYINDYVK